MQNFGRSIVIAQKWAGKGQTPVAKGPNQRLRQRTSILLLLILCVGFGLAICRLAYLQLAMGEELQQKAVEQQLTDTTINAKRGTIYDRNGEVMAQSASVWKVVLAPAYFEDDEERAIVSKGLAEILDLDQENVFEKTQKKTYYEIVKRRIDSEERKLILEFIDKIEEENDITGVISLLDDYKRYYPHNELASSILGFTGVDDQGLEGLEFEYDDYLTGKSGRIITAKNANGTNMPFQYKQNVDAEDGNNLILTIDSTIQAIVEKYMEQGIADNNVINRGVCIAMNPKTGEIIAMASVGGYNLNEPFALDAKTQEAIDALEEDKKDAAVQKARAKQWRNKAVSDIYYPGSVFKMVTSSMAMEEGVVNENTRFNCTGSYKVANRSIRCHNSGHGSQTFFEAIWHSCNPAFIQIGALVGAEKFWEYYQAFGFSDKTGIDLPGEADDLFFSETGEMTVVDLAVASFGQNFGITPIQMATAVCAVANGGNLVTPYVVKQITDKDNNVIKTTETNVKRQVISEEVSKTMCEVLEENAISGGAKNGYVAGYRVGGKTGTTEKIVEDGQKSDDYISSFCGFAPAENPEIVMLVLFDTPKGDNYYGNLVAAPVFANIMSEVLPYLDVDTQYTEDELENIDVSADSYIGLKVSDATARIEEAGLNAVVKGGGSTVLAQIPEIGSKVPAGGTVVVYTDEDSAEQTVKVPNLIGYSLSEVVDIASQYDINVSVTGATKSADAVSNEQSIAEGTEVSPGQVVTVSFITEGIND